MSSTYLAPPLQPVRPLPRRHVSLQEASTSASHESSTPLKYTSSRSEGQYSRTHLNDITNSTPKRPVPKRAHSFCASSPHSTYALASTSSQHLNGARTGLVAPPLERTLSSLGCVGNSMVDVGDMFRSARQRDGGSSQGQDADLGRSRRDRENSPPGGVGRWRKEVSACLVSSGSHTSTSLRVAHGSLSMHAHHRCQRIATDMASGQRALLVLHQAYQPSWWTSHLHLDLPVVHRISRPGQNCSLTTNLLQQRRPAIRMPAGPHYAILARDHRLTVPSV